MPEQKELYTWAKAQTIFREAELKGEDTCAAVCDWLINNCGLEEQHAKSVAAGGHMDPARLKASDYAEPEEVAPSESDTSNKARWTKDAAADVDSAIEADTEAE